MRLLVIDGNSIANRAFYGIKLLTTKDGRYTNAIYGFLNILLSLLKECQPDEVAVAFDLKAPTFRHKMYDGYKATRHAMPEELAQQMPVLKELLADLGYRTVTAEGWEADDILGTLAAACEAAGIPHRNIIAMQGPFSYALNCALMEQFSIRYLVTKDGGAVGGFAEKAQAAQDTGAQLIVVRRPAENGQTAAQILARCKEVLV